VAEQEEGGRDPKVQARGSEEEDNVLQDRVGGYAALQGLDRWRVVVNALTRLRFCAPDGTMEFATKDSAAQAPAGFMPWFDVPGRRTADITVAFGHWSTLGQQDRSDVWALDTGCVWGGCLSAMRLGEDGQHQRVQVACVQAQVPG
jgi:bis(5'-nucleosyl)-tetraphosphatase (symmetrical)